PGRSPAALLEPRLHPGNGVVPVLASRTGVPHVDRQGRRRDAARLAWHPRPAPFHRTRTLVALLGQHAVDHQRRRFVCAAVRDRPVAASRPTTWEVFPNALSTAIKYASLHFPPPEPASRFNGLQQLTYFLTFFVVAPIQIAMGLMQGPAFSNRLGWL